MIIKTGTIKSGDGPRICSYVTRQGDNEHVQFMGNSNDQLLVADDFAALRGRKNGLLHIIISPDKELTPDELAATLAAIRTEFSFNPDDPETIAIHESKRADGSSQKHYHFVRPAADSANGKTYKMFKSKCRDEVVSRLCELEFGHKLISGAHNNFVSQRLQEMGRDDCAEQVANLTNASWSAFSNNKHQQAKRQNFDLPALRQQLKELAELPIDQQARALAALIHEQGLELAPAIHEGRGRSRINIELPGDLKDHNANRTLKIKARDVASFISETKEILHVVRSNKPQPNIDFERDPASGSTLGDHQRSGADSQFQSANDPESECTTESSCSDSQKLTRETAKLAQAAADLKPQAQNFAASRNDDLTSADLEAPPDLSDPNLMIKLAAMLKKSLGGVKRSPAQTFTPNQSMLG